MRYMLDKKSLLVVVATIFTSLFFTGTVMAKNPYLQPNNSWISISGTVEAVQPDRFTLDYGDGVVIVEMDDGDRDADAYKLLPGDKVTVSGKIDDDLYEITKIEASTVFVEKLNTTFFASAVDEEDVLVITTPVVVAETVVQGFVTDVDTHEFSINTGLKTLKVDVSEMLYNPLDDKGYQKIEEGDYVRVTGTIDRNLFEGRELMAKTLTEIVD